MSELYPKRKNNRLRDYDYNQVGAYFITICTENRSCLLSAIETDGNNCTSCTLTVYGKIADKYIQQLNVFYEHISVEYYVIMPNHIHLLLVIHDSSKTSNSNLQNSVVSQFISTLKRFCNKEYGRNIWQAHFYDHVIRDKQDYDIRIKYIYENPIRWYYDELYAKE